MSQNMHRMPPVNDAIGLGWGACVVGGLPGECPAMNVVDYAPWVRTTSVDQWGFTTTQFKLPAGDAPAPQGWQCPCCRRVHAPHVNECGPCSRSAERMLPGPKDGALTISGETWEIEVTQ